jgi:transposase
MVRAGAPAGWHQASLVEDTSNVSILKLAPYSPELNPIEQVWSWHRRHYLVSRCSGKYEGIVDACTIAWNDFVNDTLRVTKNVFSRLDRNGKKVYANCSYIQQGLDVAATLCSE